MALELIDTKTTDSNGEASITYTGTGAGEIEFRAKVSTLLQETFVLEDYLFYDSGIDDDIMKRKKEIEKRKNKVKIEQLESILKLQEQFNEKLLQKIDKYQRLGLKKACKINKRGKLINIIWE